MVTSRWRFLFVFVLAAGIHSDLNAQSATRKPSQRGQPAGGRSDWRGTGPTELREQGNRSPEVTKSTSPTVPPAPSAADRSPEDGSANQSDAMSSPMTDRAFAQSGQFWKEYSLTSYSSRLPTVSQPQQAVVDWIMNQTGPETWHGEVPAVLSATRARLRVFHTNEVQAQVAEIVERFTRPIQPQVLMRVQIFATTDLNWRSGLVHLLKPAAIGPDGQHVWLIAPEDASLVRNRLKLDRQPNAISKQIMAYNGQPTAIETGQPVNYISGLELASGLYMAYQPVVDRLNEGIKATFTPLWTTDATAVDIEFRVTSRVVKRLHYAQGVAPLSSGNQEAIVQVPEVSSTSFEQSLRWPATQVLLMSCGVQVGNVSAKRGPFSFSPSASELLILVELDPPASARAATRRVEPPNR